MCSRFEQHVQKMHDWAELLKDWPSDAERRLNIKPTNSVGTLDAEGYKVRSWWLIPHWAKDLQSLKKYPTFNAKAETLKEKPSFRDPWKRSQRCIVPASAFFEWPTIDGKKLCHRISMGGGGPLFMAGLWEVWEQGDDHRDTFTIITSDPLPEIARIHNRSPVLLTLDEVDTWLHGSPGEAERLLKPHPVGEIYIEGIPRPDE